MSDGTLTAEQILDATEEVLRRYGPSKTTVVDVARALGVSHGSIYRHFADKAALRDAVTRRWLQGKEAPLAHIAAEHGPAQPRLRRWFAQLIKDKHRYVQDDPELFATYTALTADAREVIDEHIAVLVNQIAHILADGVASGEFPAIDAAAVPKVARALFDATARFHNPIHAAEWANPRVNEAFAQVFTLLLGGLGVTDPRP